MFQVNYNGLKKRDDYDEIVALITHDVSKILYPDRVPTNKNADINQFQTNTM